ncbi:MAG TPA: tetratricopeptide repeat protein, partial [Pirellulales bacterium]|nr:tetratricopeptide repeat protein [Pirellulales bacterium]
EQARRALAAAEPEQACQWLDAAAQRQPDCAEAHYLLAVALRRLARYRLAEEHLQRAERLGWQRTDLELQGRLIEFQRGNIAEAEPFLTNVLETGGSDDVAEEIYEALVIGYLGEYRFANADMILKHWIKWRPDSLRARLLCAYFYGVISDSEQQQLELREVLRIAPRRLTERLALAESLVGTTQIDEAVVECEICQNQAPHDPRVLFVLGLCHYRRGRLEEAKSELERAVEDDETLDARQLAQGFITLAQIVSAVRDFEAAALYYEKAVKLTPNDSAPAYGLGTTLKILGQDELAERHLQCSRRLEEQACRLADIKELLLRGDHDATLYLQAARILLECGQKRDAAAWLLNALHLDPNLRAAHELLADFCEEHGEFEQAARHREAARLGQQVAETFP